MNILIMGLGVIGSTYGYLFQKMGHHTEHLLRGNSNKKNVRELEVHLFDGRTNPRGAWSDGTYAVTQAEGNQEYDFIFVSVPQGGIASAMEFLKERNIHGTVVLACGIWEDHRAVEQVMEGWEYILGYPVAGGSLADTKLDCCVFDHFMLEAEEKSHAGNYQKLIQLFAECSIKPEIPYDMLEWIWLHMAINAGVISVAGKYGDIRDTSASAEKLMDSAGELSEAVLAIRETSQIIAARGVKLKNYRNELLPYRIPSKLAGVIMKRMFAGNLLTRKIMTLHSNLQDLMFVCRQISQYGKNQLVPAPIFYDSCKKIGM